MRMRKGDEDMARWSTRNRAQWYHNASIWARRNTFSSCEREKASVLSSLRAKARHTLNWSSGGRESAIGAKLFRKGRERKRTFTFVVKTLQESDELDLIPLQDETDPRRLVRVRDEDLSMGSVVSSPFGARGSKDADRP